VLDNALTYTSSNNSFSFYTADFLTYGTTTYEVVAIVNNFFKTETSYQFTVDVVDCPVSISVPFTGSRQSYTID